ncbi:MAG: hypothetical protein AAFO91_03570 [Bacteroidota bacterium]
MNRKTATALIELSAEDGASPVSIQYVKQDGSIKIMRIRKSRKKGQSAEQGESKVKSYHVRDRGLINVVDLQDGRTKSLFIFCMVGINTSGHPKNFESIQNGS